MLDLPVLELELARDEFSGCVELFADSARTVVFASGQDVKQFMSDDATNRASEDDRPSYTFYPAELDGQKRPDRVAIDFAIWDHCAVAEMRLAKHRGVGNVRPEVRCITVPMEIECGNLGP